MKKVKLKFSRAKWYVGYFNFLDSYKVEQWCIKQFGPAGDKNDAWSRWHYNFGVISFRDEDDRVLFKLKWPPV